MAEPFTYLGAASASTGTLIKIIQHSFAYGGIPHDVQAFQNSIESFSGTLDTAKRLRRVKSHLLDSKEKTDIDQNIKRAEAIFKDISTTIEACRKDMSTMGTVSARNRILWMLRDHQAFMSKTHTLSICHQNLTCDIGSMRQLQMPTPTLLDETVDFSASLRPPSRRSAMPARQLVAFESSRLDHLAPSHPSSFPERYISGNFQLSPSEPGLGSFSNLSSTTIANSIDGTHLNDQVSNTPLLTPTRSVESDDSPSLLDNSSSVASPRRSRSSRKSFMIV